MVLTLTRNAYTEMGTFGLIDVCGAATFYTVERPWLDNAPSVSCIPEGRYPIRQRRFHRGGYNTYEVAEVPCRSAILIHRANMARELAGCVGLGRSLGCVGGQWAVLRSADAFAAFMEAMDGAETGEIIVTQYVPTQAT